MRSLKFKIIAVHKIFKNKNFTTVGINNVNFNDD